MKRSYLWVALIAILSALVVSKAYALWREVQITPKNATALDRAFQVTVQEREGQQQFAVTVERKGGKKLSPFLSARLFIASEEITVGTVPVEEKRSGDRVTYWFRLAPRFLSRSRFELDESNYVERKGTRSQPQKEILMGGTSYWFSLRDFNHSSAAEEPKR